MNKKTLAVFGAAIVVAVIIIAIISAASGSSTPSAVKKMKTTANSFIAPAGATTAVPDSSVKNPPSYTKQWSTTSNVTDACTAWGGVYRTWVGTTQIGKVTGSMIPNQSCNFSGPKDGFTATLQVAVYGSDPKPSVTLTIS